MRCNICNKETEIIKKEKYQYTLSRLSNLFLKNIKVEVCENCETEIPIIPKILRLHNTIARALLCQKTLLRGEEVKFLRKHLRIKAQDWAKFLRKDVATISRAEKEGNVLNKDLDLLVRLAYVRIWEEKNETFFDEKIPESFSNNEFLTKDIVIDVENIEEFSYLEKEKVWESLSGLTFEEPNRDCIISLRLSIKTDFKEEYAKHPNIALAA